jgi:Glu-tRNA(Gln) amidotransferase subunit E-like FAD-binding protein
VKETHNPFDKNSFTYKEIKENCIKSILDPHFRSLIANLNKHYPAFVDKLYGELKQLCESIKTIDKCRKLTKDEVNVIINAVTDAYEWATKERGWKIEDYVKKLLISKPELLCEFCYCI